MFIVHVLSHALTDYPTFGLNECVLFIYVSYLYQHPA